MNKKFSKPIYLLIVIVSLFVFIVNLATFYLGNHLNSSNYIQIVFLIIGAIFIGTAIGVGATILNPTLSDAMITLRRLMRAENLSNPLLMKLSTTAPGTYHHSLNVSTLAQKAAKMIKADSLLVRTAAYYHDIGKIENPEIFVENITDSEIDLNDETIDIKKNAEEIISHVEKGVEIAQKNNLPDEIINLIKEHHGTTYALYFFSKAKENGLKIEKTDYRYKGPIPQSKESVILMLSDCVEAITRSTKDLDAKKIKDIVKNTIEDKINDKQISGSDISNSELNKIGISLENTLISIYHQRIQYK